MEFFARVDKFLSKSNDAIARGFDKVTDRASGHVIQPFYITNRCLDQMNTNMQIIEENKLAPMLFTVYLDTHGYNSLYGEFISIAKDSKEKIIKHAKEEGFTFEADPLVVFEYDAGYRPGKWKVIGECIEAAELEKKRKEAIARFDPASALKATLTKCDSEEKGTPLTGESIQIGRSRKNDIVVSDMSASAFHAVLVRGKDCWTIEDNHSTNGIKVNGEQVSSASLKNGDIITIGRMKFLYEQA